MNKGKKIISMSLAASMLLSSAAGFAIPQDTVIIGQKVFLLDDLENDSLKDEINEAIMSAEDIYYSISGITNEQFVDIEDGLVISDSKKKNLGELNLVKEKDLEIRFDNVDDEKGTALVSTREDIESLFNDKLVDKIELKKEIDLGEESLEITKLVDIDLNGKKLRGNLVIKTEEKGKIKIEGAGENAEGGIEGKITMDAENAEVELDTKVSEIEAKKPFKLITKKDAKIEKVDEKSKEKIEAKDEKGENVDIDKIIDKKEEKPEPKPKPNPEPYIPPTPSNHVPNAKDQIIETTATYDEVVDLNKLFSDADGDRLRYELVSGDGFEVNRNTGELSFYVHLGENKTGDKRHVVVRAFDGKDWSRNVRLTIVIADKSEGSVSLAEASEKSAGDAFEVQFSGVTDRSGVIIKNMSYSYDVISDVEGKIGEIEARLVDGAADIMLPRGLMSQGQHAVKFVPKDVLKGMKTLELSVNVGAPTKNIAPVGRSHDAKVGVGEEFELDLDTIFTDANDNELSYKIVGMKMGTMANLSGDRKNILRINASADNVNDGAGVLVVANDGELDSEAVNVSLKVEDKSDFNVELTVPGPKKIGHRFEVLIKGAKGADGQLLEGAQGASVRLNEETKVRSTGGLFVNGEAKIVLDSTGITPGNNVFHLKLDRTRESKALNVEFINAPNAKPVGTPTSVESRGLKTVEIDVKPLFSDEDGDALEYGGFKTDGAGRVGLKSGTSSVLEYVPSPEDLGKVINLTAYCHDGFDESDPLNIKLTIIDSTNVNFELINPKQTVVGRDMSVLIKNLTGTDGELISTGDDSKVSISVYKQGKMTSESVVGAPTTVFENQLFEFENGDIKSPILIPSRFGEIGSSTYMFRIATLPKDVFYTIELGENHVPVGTRAELTHGSGEYFEYDVSQLFTDEDGHELQYRDTNYPIEGDNIEKGFRSDRKTLYFKVRPEDRGKQREFAIVAVDGLAESEPTFIAVNFTDLSDFDISFADSFTKRPYKSFDVNIGNAKDQRGNVINGNTKVKVSVGDGEKVEVDAQFTDGSATISIPQNSLIAAGTHDLKLSIGDSEIVKSISVDLKDGDINSLPAAKNVTKSIVGLKTYSLNLDDMFTDADNDSMRFFAEKKEGASGELSVSEENILEYKVDIGDLGKTVEIRVSAYDDMAMEGGKATITLNIEDPSSITAHIVNPDNRYLGENIKIQIDSYSDYYGAVNPTKDVYFTVVDDESGKYIWLGSMIEKTSLVNGKGIIDIPGKYFKKFGDLKLNITAEDVTTQKMISLNLTLKENHAPTGIEKTVTIGQETSYTLNVSELFTDQDGHTLEYKYLDTTSHHGDGLKLESDGVTFNYSITNEDRKAGEAAFLFEASDGISKGEGVLELNVAEYSSSDTALEVDSAKDAGESFNLLMTNAKDFSGNALSGEQTISITSDKGDIVSDISTSFTSGSATITIPESTLTTIGTHELTISNANIMLADTVSVQIEQPNRKPVGRNIEASAVVGTPYVIDLNTVFTDPDDDAMTYEIVSEDGASTADLTGSNLSYTGTSEDPTDPVNIVLKANDGEMDSDNYTITITVSAE
jgi:hypothetical protein